jgi:hypothetical protein
MTNPRHIAGTERRGVTRREIDIRHLENQARLLALETNQAEIKNDQAQILAQMKELAGLFEFLRDARVGIKWSGRVGRAIVWIGKIVGGLLVLSGLWKAGEHFIK